MQDKIYKQCIYYDEVLSNKIWQWASNKSKTINKVILYVTVLSFSSYFFIGIEEVCTFLWLLQGIQIVTGRKTIFPFSRCPEKMVFPKNLRWNMIFLALLGKMIYLFLENRILCLRRKMKDDLAQKIHGNILSSNFLKRWSFQIWPCQHIIFLVSSEKIVVFFSKTWYLFPGQKVRGGLSQKLHGNMTFSVYTYGCFKRGVTPLRRKKNQRWSYPAKIHLKVIDIPDSDPTKSSSNSLYFHEDLYRRFHALLFSEEKQET